MTSPFDVAAITTQLSAVCGRIVPSVRRHAVGGGRILATSFVPWRWQGAQCMRVLTQWQAIQTDISRISLFGRVCAVCYFKTALLYSCTIYISRPTTNLAACVCVCAKCDQFLPARFYFESKRPGNFVRIAKFPYAAFGPLFAFHCPLFFTRNNDLERKSSRFAVIVRSSVADKQLA